MQIEHVNRNSLAMDADATNINGGMLPCGFRFVPTNEELVLHYLTKKITGETVGDLNIIHEVRLYEKHPSRLTQEYEPHGESEWFFFTKRDKRCPNGERPNRGTGDGTGYWKLIDKGKAIPKGRAIGLKHTLDFIEGRGKTSSTRTKWKMHEYLLEPSHVNSLVINADNDKMVENWVLCKLYLNKRASSLCTRTARDNEMVSRPSTSYSSWQHGSFIQSSMMRLPQQIEEESGDDAKLAQQLEEELEQAAGDDAKIAQLEEQLEQAASDDAKIAQQLEEQLEQADGDDDAMAQQIDQQAGGDAMAQQIDQQAGDDAMAQQIDQQAGHDALQNVSVI